MIPFLTWQKAAVVQLWSYVLLFMATWAVAHQGPLSTTSWSLPKFMCIDLVLLYNHLILCTLFFCLQSFPASESFLTSWLFISGGQSIGALASALVLSMSIPGLISFRIGWFDLLAVQGTHKSSPAPQFKGINSLVVTLLCGPTLTSRDDYWKNHSFDYMGLCPQSDVSAF